MRGFLTKDKQMKTNAASFSVIINGDPAKTYYHNGRTFIEAKEGSEFEIKIQNHTWGRVLAVASVDGLSVLTGEPASIEDGGYILNGHGKYQIKGFRISNSEVGAFKFTKKEGSYAADKGEAQNVGVIGVRVFSEYVVPSYNNSIKIAKSRAGGQSAGNDTLRCFNMSNTTTCSVTSDFAPEKAGFDMGTTWGSEKQSHVVDGQFVRSTEIFFDNIYYASRESLRAMGVPIDVKPTVAFPDSFPKKYATPPPRWKR